MPLRIENVTPADDLAYYLDTVHWLDALTPPLESGLHQLSTTVRALLAAAEHAPPSGEILLDDTEAARVEDEARDEDERRQEEVESKLRTDEEERRKQDETEAQQRAESERVRDEEAKKRAAEERAFVAAKLADTVSTLDEFIASYPEGRLVAEATSLRAALAERDDAYKTAISSDNAAVLQAFLKRYSKGKPTDQVKRRLRQLQPRSRWFAFKLAVGAVGLVLSVGLAAYFFINEPLCFDAVCGTTWGYSDDNNHYEIHFSENRRVGSSLGEGGSYSLIGNSINFNLQATFISKYQGTIEGQHMNGMVTSNVYNTTWAWSAVRK